MIHSLKSDLRKRPGERPYLDLSLKLGAHGLHPARAPCEHDQVTDQVVIVIAGIGPYGTESAAEFAMTPASMRELAPSDSMDQGKANMEAVIETQVIDGKPGHSSLIAKTFW